MHVSSSWSFGSVLNMWDPKHVHVTELEQMVCGPGTGFGRSKLENVADSGLWHYKSSWLSMRFPLVYMMHPSSSSVCRNCKTQEKWCRAPCCILPFIAIILPWLKTKRLTGTFEEHTSIISWACRSEGVGKGIVLGNVLSSSISVLCKLYSTTTVAPLPEGMSNESAVLKGQQHLSMWKSSTYIKWL